MILKYKLLLILYFSAVACAFKTQNDISCIEQYNNGRQQDCFSCCKTRLVDDSLNLTLIQLIAECAQTPEELNYVNTYMKNHQKYFLGSHGYLISFSDVCVKLGDTVYSNYLLSIVDKIYNNRIPPTRTVEGRDKTITSVPNFYKTAEEYWNQYLDREKKGEFIPVKQKKMDLNFIINCLISELEYSPNNSEASTLKDQVSDLYTQLK